MHRARHAGHQGPGRVGTPLVTLVPLLVLALPFVSGPAHAQQADGIARRVESGEQPGYAERIRRLAGSVIDIAAEMR